MIDVCGQRWRELLHDIIAPHLPRPLISKFQNLGILDR